MWQKCRWSCVEWGSHIDPALLDENFPPGNDLVTLVHNETVRYDESTRGHYEGPGQVPQCCLCD